MGEDRNWHSVTSLLTKRRERVRSEEEQIAAAVAASLAETPGARRGFAVLAPIVVCVTCVRGCDAVVGWRLCQAGHRMRVPTRQTTTTMP